MNFSRCLPLLLLPVLVAASLPGTPEYSASGDFVPPADYRDWVFMSSGIDMSYGKGPPMQGASMFDNVFVDPASWQSFKRTGHWPDKTMFAMEARGAASHESINRNGQFQTAELMGVEFHVRDDSRFRGGWAFFVQDGDTAKLVPATADCYACHAANGAVDTTFTQFYPTAKVVAVRAGTFVEPKVRE